MTSEPIPIPVLSRSGCPMRHPCAPAPRFFCKPDITHRDPTAWLGRQDSNLGIRNLCSRWLHRCRALRRGQIVQAPARSPGTICCHSAGWCQALSDYPSIRCGMFTRRVLASLRDRHLGPPMMGSGGCGGPICRGVLAARFTAGIRTRNGLASSIVPAGTWLHRSAEFTFLLSCYVTSVHALSLSEPSSQT